MPSHPVRIIVRRSLNLSKTHVLLSIAIAANGILLSSLGNTLSANSPIPGDVDIHTSLPLLAIPLLTTSALTITIPVILLFVYDKNNGVLERFLSLGMNQADIYRRYLKASVLLTLTFLPIILVAYLSTGWFVGTNVTILLEVAGLLIVLSLSVVTLVTVSMMAFGSLQRERVGASQPIGIGLGGLVILPDYIIPFTEPTEHAVSLELAIGLAIGAVAILLLFLSSKLISREKLLP